MGKPPKMTRNGRKHGDFQPDSLQTFRRIDLEREACCV